MNRNSRIFAAVAAVVLLIGGLAGGYAWGSSRADTTSSSSKSPANTTLSSVANKGTSTGHNAADVMFAQMMTLHHRQALDMAKLADSRAGSARIKTLAAKIEAAQQPEIDTMNDWLKHWGAKTNSGPMSGSVSGMHHTMPGGMSESDMTSLKQASGGDFDKQFLTMMIEHHQGAVTMAQDELKSGNNADALGLASSIYVSQQGQIDQMEALLT